MGVLGFSGNLRGGMIHSLDFGKKYLEKIEMCWGLMTWGKCNSAFCFLLDNENKVFYIFHKSIWQDALYIYHKVVRPLQSVRFG